MFDKIGTKTSVILSCLQLINTIGSTQNTKLQTNGYNTIDMAIKDI